MTNLITETTDKSFELDVKNAQLPVLLDCWAPWCGPCKAFEPTLIQLAANYKGRLSVVKYNVDDPANSWERLDIRGIPTLIVYRRGSEIARSTGATASKLNALLSVALQTIAPERPELVSFFGVDKVKVDGVAHLEAAVPTRVSDETVIDSKNSSKTDSYHQSLRLQKNE